jgi:membrane associated rhomboid family serine protease
MPSTVKGRAMAQPADPPPPAVNPLPPVVLGLAVVIIGIEGMFSLGARGLVGGPEAAGWRLAAVQDWGFIDRLFDLMLARGDWPPRQVARVLTYPLIHSSFTHALMACVFILAIGNMVGRVFSGMALLALFFAASAIGALVYALVVSAEGVLIGAYPGVYGLIGAFTFVVWIKLAAEGGPQHRAFGLIAVLLGVQLLFAVFFGAGPEWIADIAGFGAGFLLSFILVPGGWQRLVARLRQRR